MTRCELTPVFKMIAGRVPQDMHLASQPAISRLENSVTAANLLMMQDWFIERFIDSFATPPDRITLDIDTMEDPTHGQVPSISFTRSSRDSISDFLTR